MHHANAEKKPLIVDEGAASLSIRNLLTTYRLSLNIESIKFEVKEDEASFICIELKDILVGRALNTSKSRISKAKSQPYNLDPSRQAELLALKNNDEVCIASIDSIALNTKNSDGGIHQMDVSYNSHKDYQCLTIKVRDIGYKNKPKRGDASKKRNTNLSICSKAVANNLTTQRNSPRPGANEKVTRLPESSNGNNKPRFYGVEIGKLKFFAKRVEIEVNADQLEATFCSDDFDDAFGPFVVFSDTNRTQKTEIPSKIESKFTDKLNFEKVELSIAHYKREARSTVDKATYNITCTLNKMSFELIQAQAQQTSTKPSTSGESSKPKDDQTSVQKVTLNDVLRFNNLPSSSPLLF